MRVFPFVVVVAAIVGCGGGSEAVEVDAGAGDAGAGDAGATDGGAGDAGADASVSRDPYPHACTYARDNQADGLYDWIAIYDLDAAGNVLRDETDADGDRSVDFVNVMKYDDEGRIVRRELDEDNDGEIDFEYRTEYRDDGQIERTRDYDSAGEMIAGLEYIYDDDGFLIEMAGDLPGEHTHGEDSLMTFENDADGCLIATALDRYADGEVEESTVRENDAACRPLMVDIDRFDDGTVDTVWLSEYDEDGNQVHEKHVDQGITVLERTSTWENGLKVRMVEVHGTSRDVTRYDYDSAGNLVRVENDKFDDGMFIEVTTYELDSRGNVLYSFIDDRGDGHPDDMAAYTYDCWE
jgi:hypothetical protein